MTILSVYVCTLFLFGLWPMNFREHNHAASNHRDGLILSPPSTVYSKELPEKLLNLREFTICIDMSSDFSPSKGFGTILSYALDYERINFLVGQWRSGIELRIASDDHARAISFGRKNVFRKGNPSWFSIVYDGNVMFLYQDGKKIAARRTGPLTFSTWNRSYPLVIGSDASGRSSWKGTIRSIAIFNRALQGNEILDIPGRLRELAPLICYSYTKTDGTTVADCGTPPPAHLIIPQRLVPYQRVFLELPIKKHGKFPGGLMDITINLIGFIPLGFFLSLYMSQKNSSLARSLLISIAVGVSISLLIGSALGAWLYHFGGGSSHAAAAGSITGSADPRHNLSAGDR